MRARLLRTLYDRSIDGLPVLGTPEDVARRFSSGPGSLRVYADRLVAFYTTVSGATGFVMGLPGLLLAPITIPGDIAGTAMIQLHMAAALAHMGGRDIRDDAVRDECVDCLLEKINKRGKNSEEEEVAGRFGVQLAQRGLRIVTEQATKWGMRAARSFAFRRLGLRGVPIVGGLMGGGSDAYLTSYVGRCAKAAFLDDAYENEDVGA